jgi:hypothetical protein
MIPKAPVKIIGVLHFNNHRYFVVAGYEDNIGFYPAHKKRSYHNYDQALRYSLELSSYYQAEVKEVIK